MRIQSIFAKDVLPVRRFDAEGLSDVVVIAGRNGVGKTRLFQAIVNAFRNPGQGPVRLLIEATSDDEMSSWQRRTLDTAVPNEAALLRSLLQAQRRRRNWTSGVFQIESDRKIEKIQPYKFSWDAADPFEENVGWESTLQTFTARFQDTVQSIFRKVHQLEAQLGSTAFRLGREGKTEMKLGFTDPVEPFRNAFYQLLAPKELLDVDPRVQRLNYSHEGQVFDATQALSSGEREVVNIVFDILLRRPSHCVIFVDEPELHLHPELSYKLLSTLRTIGTNNQFFLSTHSPDIITASLDQSVIFVSPARSDGGNQALAVTEEDETHAALRALGHSIGVVALGRKVVLIEGTDTSLDKQTYSSLLHDRCPSLVLVPSEGKGTIASFAVVNERVLQRSIWGVEFFMLCDRDVVPLHRDAEGLKSESRGRLAVLGRYHLENYFLDATCLAEVFRSLEPASSWLRDPLAIREVLLSIARNRLSHATALHAAARLRDRVGNVDVMPSGCHDVSLDHLCGTFVAGVKAEQARVGAALESDEATRLVEQIWRSLEADLETERWNAVFPGRPILRQFASKSSLAYGRLKSGYLEASRAVDHRPFSEVIEIFEVFEAAGDGAGPSLRG